jgi:hypothetical protein
MYTSEGELKRGEEKKYEFALRRLNFFFGLIDMVYRPKYI